MSEIYANCDCNLSATGMASGKDGMLLPRGSQYHTGLELSVHHLKCIVHDPGYYREEDPLSPRGWVF